METENKNILQRYWVPKDIAEIRHPLQETITKRFSPSPDDLVQSRAHRMPLSRHGSDKGAIRQELKMIEIGREEKRPVYARAVKDNLDRLRENGSICEDALTAARLFQAAFDHAGYAKYSSANTNVVGTGNITIEDIMAQSMHSRNMVHAVYDLLGGSTTHMSIAVHWYVGMGLSFEAIGAKHKGNNKHYWRAMLTAALQLMGQEYVRKSKTRRVRQTTFINT